MKHLDVQWSKMAWKGQIISSLYNSETILFAVVNGNSLILVSHVAVLEKQIKGSMDGQFFIQILYLYKLFAEPFM